MFLVFTLGLFSAWAALKALFGFLPLVTSPGVLGELSLEEPSAYMQIENWTDKRQENWNFW